MRSIARALGFLTCLASTACTAGDSSESSNAKKILGSWEGVGLMVRTYEFEKEGTYTSTVKSKDGDVFLTLKGTYAVEGNTLTVRIPART
jgi:uncharacterized protein (TIGR03066 family)